MNQEDDEVLPDDKSITIYYKPNDSSWKTPKVHYGLGDDWNQTEADMTLDAQGYYTATIDTKGKKIDFVFHDAGTDQWENPKGGGNYHANAGITHVGVADQAATVGNPESIGGQTRLVVHYKPASASDNRGVYVLGQGHRRYGHQRREPRLHRHRLLGQGRHADLRRQVRELRLHHHQQRLEQVRR